MNNCIFCKIINREIPAYIIYEDDDVLAFLDIEPISKGHTLIIPKKHYQNLTETSDELIMKMGVINKKIALNILNKLKPQGLNYLINQEAIAGQVIFHYHQHIIPKYDAKNGLTINQNIINNDSYNLETIKKEICIK
ncbi:HIT family protein [Spiroplasma endosymbiont of Amphibalanus improvisus]|uniref:HIT family protein n=1 Tax=Spiroplasma endosymbiont of Amphibalanus improvisus TaxID=3066327 RepID=UPI00313DC82A